MFVEYNTPDILTLKTEFVSFLNNILLSFNYISASAIGNLFLKINDNINFEFLKFFFTYFVSVRLLLIA